jgi:ribosomal protein L29
MKIQDLKKLDAQELANTLNESLTQLALLRRKSVEGQLKDVREIREVRQTIARIKTILSASRA